MQLSGRPLLDNTADQALFVNREEILSKIDGSLRTGLNCLVVGDPGGGKTSLVRALMYRTQVSDRPLQFTYVRANRARTAGDLLASVLAALRVEVPGPLPALELVDVLAGAVLSANDSGTGNRVIVAEDVSGDAGAELFGALRDEVWQVDAQWLVTASTAQAPSLLRPPADVFFETRMELESAYRRAGGRAAAPAPGRRKSSLPTASSRRRDSVGQTPRRLLELARELAAEPAVGGMRLTTVAG